MKVMRACTGWYHSDGQGTTRAGLPGRGPEWGPVESAAYDGNGGKMRLSSRRALPRPVGAIVGLLAGGVPDAAAANLFDLLFRNNSSNTRLEENRERQRWERQQRQRQQQRRKVQQPRAAAQPSKPAPLP